MNMLTAYGVLDIKDFKIKKMLNEINTCNKLGIPIRKNIKDFFSKVGNNHPENLPVVYRIANDLYEGEIWVDVKTRKWKNDIQEGIEIDIGNLPKEVKKIRVV